MANTNRKSDHPSTDGHPHMLSHVDNRLMNFSGYIRSVRIPNAKTVLCCITNTRRRVERLLCRFPVANCIQGSNFFHIFQPPEAFSRISRKSAVRILNAQMVTGMYSPASIARQSSVTVLISKERHITSGIRPLIYKSIRGSPAADRSYKNPYESSGANRMDVSCPAYWPFRLVSVKKTAFKSSIFSGSQAPVA